MKFKADEESIAKLLSEAETQFVVPIYQRPYSWTVAEIDQLWEDIRTIGQGDYFLGSVVLNIENPARPEIIDGQQRLSTICLLSSLIRNKLRTLGHEHWARPNRLLVTDEFADDAEARFRLKLGESNWEVFRDFFMKQEGDPGHRSIDQFHKLPKQVQLENATLFDGYQRLDEHLTAEIKGLDKSSAITRLETLQSTISKRLILVAIRVENIEDAFILFETLNDRGLQLSAADLVKSHLFSRYEQQHGREAVREAQGDWQEVMEGLEGGDIGRFLRYFLLQTHEKVQSAKIFSLFKRRLEDSTPTEVLDSLRLNARNFGELINPARVDHEGVRAVLERLIELRASTVYIALIPARSVFVDDPLQFAAFCRLAEALLFRWTYISGRNAQQLESVFQRAASALASGSDPEDVVAELRTQMPSRDEFIANFSTKQMGTQYVARYALRRLEDALTDGLEHKPPRKVHLEHVMPQTPSDEWLRSLGKNAAEVHAGYVSRWGNLTLLASRLNQKARNKSFEKKDIYRGRDKTSRALSVGSAIQLTRLLDGHQTWGPAEISARQEWMAEIADQVWGAPGIAGSPITIPDYPA